MGAESVSLNVSLGVKSHQEFALYFRKSYPKNPRIPKLQNACEMILHIIFNTTVCVVNDDELQ